MCGQGLGVAEDGPGKGRSLRGGVSAHLNEDGPLPLTSHMLPHGAMGVWAQGAGQADGERTASSPPLKLFMSS